MTDSQLRVDPARLSLAARDLDTIADRLEAALAGAGHRSPMPAQGRDEVSVAAAESFTESAETFDRDAAAGVLELRKIAAALRARSSGFADSEDEITQIFRV